jgi:tetratricopeptide (TPR) repeat protein
MGSVSGRSIAAGLLAIMASLGCAPAAVNADAVITVDEITDPVTPPGPQVIDASGQRQLGASPLELRAAGDFYYRAGELDRAEEFYRACHSDTDGELRAACLWAMGAVLIARTQAQVAEGLHEAEGCVRRDPPAPLECTEEARWLENDLGVLRVAYRGHPTPRRALVIGTLYEQLGDDAEALRFYLRGLGIDPNHRQLAQAVARLRSRGPRPECPECSPQPGVEVRPRDCPSLPFDWHRRTGELAIVGSELEGSSRERILACFGEPRGSSLDVWSYRSSSCTPANDGRMVTVTVRLRFEGDAVVAVTHERVIEDRACDLLITD